MSPWWMDIALCVGFATLACLLIRIRYDLRQSIAQVLRVTELPAASAGGERRPDGWPPHAALQANSPAPPQLQSKTDGSWVLAVFGRDAAQVEAVLPQDDLGLLRSRYSLLAAVLNDSGTVGEIDLVPIPESTLDGVPLPSVGMIDPDGLIQGVGSVVDDIDLLAFVHDGEHRGFGPAAVDRVTPINTPIES